MRIDNELKLDYDDVLIRPKRSTLNSRKDVGLERTYSFLHSSKTWTGIPIVASNMASSGTFEMARVFAEHKMLVALHKHYTLDELGVFFYEHNYNDYIIYTTGIRDEDYNKLNSIIKMGLHDKFSFICIDVPNAYLERVVGKVREIRKLFPDHIIIAGNVVTNEMTEELLLNGADIVKVGIGSGGACLTRVKAGVGYPQLSAVIETSDAAHGIGAKHEGRGNGLICADGGTVYPACIAKALCAGADFVMVGSQLAGYDQSGGDIVVKDNVNYKMHYGSSSNTAMIKNYGSVDSHRASEGRTALVPLKGDVNNWIQDVLGSLRSTGTYIGARNLKEFPRRATFVRVSSVLNKAYEKYDYDDNTAL
ncbi:MAG: GMP reductase [Candidatus Woesearchaeota archaeon]